jgi:hypothetical protein
MKGDVVDPEYHHILSCDGHEANCLYNTLPDERNIGVASNLRHDSSDFPENAFKN